MKARVKEVSGSVRSKGANMVGNLKFQYADAGRTTGERLDCAVRAASLFFDLPYLIVHKTFEQFGRESRQATPFFITLEALDALSEKTGKSIERITIDDSCRTIGRIAKKYSNCTLLIRIRRHLFCIKQSTQLDTYVHGKRCGVVSAWILKKVGG